MCGGIESLKQRIASCIVNSRLQLSELYTSLHPISAPVTWHETVWEKLNYPKHSFILWLAVQDKLQTQDRLMKHGIIQSSICKLCDGSNAENRSHLFFECSMSTYVWNSIMEWLNFKWRCCVWSPLMNWYSFRLRGRGLKQRIKRMALAATVYNIWRERNCRIFKLQSRTADYLIKNIKLDILTAILNKSLPEECREWVLSL
ncbi:uncharacterized protein LOC109831261 [Asparagus officinalis]|uniref:uncharacterized protein LOC109831261 n=1 Tax=Asparagus officinalis TaxID=4686 RepID=UPI00098E13AA|nr:uncharacterized protein LOC109831261 [Asparagus officinalis]